MKVDEKAYRLQIRQVFAAALSQKIMFQAYLNFSVNTNTSTNTTPPSAPAPTPENKCVDVCSIAAGQISGTAGMISGGARFYAWIPAVCNTGW
jgi:hypothetical protein